jgi:hypothetical protein
VLKPIIATTNMTNTTTTTEKTGKVRLFIDYMHVIAAAHAVCLRA